MFKDNLLIRKTLILSTQIQAPMIKNNKSNLNKSTLQAPEYEMTREEKIKKHVFKSVHETKKMLKKNPLVAKRLAEELLNSQPQLQPEYVEPSKHRNIQKSTEMMN